MSFDSYLYRDDGCRLFHACLECPLPKCRYDTHIAGARTDTATRNAEVLSYYHQGIDLERLASGFNISKRTVYRIVSGVNGNA